MRHPGPGDTVPGPDASMATQKSVVREIALVPLAATVREKVAGDGTYSIWPPGAWTVGTVTV